MNLRILISGASGLVGGALLPSLKTSGCSVVRLVRGSSAPGADQIPWDPSQALAPETVSGFDAVIHLAGESIFGRWTEAKKAKICDSRILSTRNLAQAVSQAREKPKVFISASAIGYYGTRGDETLNEESSPGTGFAADLAQQWELASLPAVEAGVRTVQMRIGIVLSPKGGALATMLTPFKLGLGGPTGSGRQWMSWIDIRDIVGAIHHILKSDLIQGPVNMVAPIPVTNAEFAKTLASALSRPAIFPMPEFAVKLIFGEMGEELLLGSQKVEPGKLISSGYPFRYREVKASLEGLLKG